MCVRLHVLQHNNTAGLLEVGGRLKMLLTVSCVTKAQDWFVINFDKHTSEAECV